MPALSAVLIHESGHIIAASLFGVNIIRGRRFFGIRIVIDGTERIGYVREAAIYAAGAIFNLLSLMIPEMPQDFYLYSLGAAIFNLIPFDGSDGAGVLRALLLCVLQPVAAEKITNLIGTATLLLLWVFAVYMNINGKGSLALLLAVVALLLLKAKN